MKKTVALVVVVCFSFALGWFCRSLRAMSDRSANNMRIRICLEGYFDLYERLSSSKDEALVRQYMKDAKDVLGQSLTGKDVLKNGASEFFIKWERVLQN